MFPSAASQSQKKLFGKRVSAELGGAASRGLALPGHEWAHRHHGCAGRSCGMEQPCRRMLLMCSWGRAALGRGAASSRAGAHLEHAASCAWQGTSWHRAAEGRGVLGAAGTGQALPARPCSHLHGAVCGEAPVGPWWFWGTGTAEGRSQPSTPCV